MDLKGQRAAGQGDETERFASSQNGTMKVSPTDNRGTRSGSGDAAGGAPCVRCKVLRKMHAHSVSCSFLARFFFFFGAQTPVGWELGSNVQVFCRLFVPLY